MENDHHITIAEIASEVELSVGSVHTMLSDALGNSSVSKVGSTSHKKTNKCLKDIRQQLLNRFEEGETFLDHIVTCDKTWVHYYTLESKRNIE